MLERQLAASAWVSGEIDLVDVSFLPPRVDIVGLRVQTRVAEPHQVTADVERLTVKWAFSELGGRPRVVLIEPHVHLPPAPRLPSVGRESGTRPIPFRQLVLRAGSLTIQPSTEQLATAIKLVEVNAKIHDTAHDGGRESLTGTIEATANLVGGGRLEFDGSFSPGSPASTWDLGIVLEGLSLVELNPYARQYLQMDVERGTLSARGRLTASSGMLRGHITPEFHDLELLGDGRRTTPSPMAEALFQQMLETSQQMIPIERPLARTPEDAQRIDPLSLLERTIRRGYQRRLDTLDHYSASVGQLDVDFEAGMLRFRDVMLFKSKALVPLPFFFAEELNVRVERSLLDRRTDHPVYKHVELVSPRLRFVIGPTDETSQLQFDPEWQAKVSALPYPTESLSVHDGGVELWDLSHRDAGFLFITDLRVEGGRMDSGRNAERPPAVVELSATVEGGGYIGARVEYRPDASPPDLELGLGVDKLNLANLGSITRSAVGIEVAAGTLSIAGHLKTRDGVLRAIVVPRLRNVNLLANAPAGSARPLREVIVDRKLRQLDGRPLRVHIENDDPFAELPKAMLGAILKR